ncbi:hypothetical protein BLOT_000957 [Blomia tropicalis]|nr:hypothetical protein BLOT_000957 [Blomia tropicalis]
MATYLQLCEYKYAIYTVQFEILQCDSDNDQLRNNYDQNDYDRDKKRPRDRTPRAAAPTP